MSALHGWVWDGEKFAPCDSVPLSDRGFRYGMSLFESLSVHSGIVELWGAHRLRLALAAATLGFSAISTPLDATCALLETCGVNGFARIYITAGDGSPATAANAPRVFVFIEPDATADASPCTLRIHEDTFAPVFGGLKTANYWMNCHALAQARAAGFHEALLFNDRAELISACCANVFLVHDNAISTPGRSAGCRDGTVREWVLARRPVAERRLRREDVLAADGLFLTNSRVGIQPVAAIEGRVLGPCEPARLLAREFLESVRNAQKKL